MKLLFFRKIIDKKKRDWIELLQLRSLSQSLFLTKVSLILLNILYFIFIIDQSFLDASDCVIIRLCC